jgi:hypothetical protein
MREAKAENMLFVKLYKVIATTKDFFIRKLSYTQPFHFGPYTMAKVRWSRLLRGIL